MTLTQRILLAILNVHHWAMKQYLSMFLESDQGKTVTEGAKTFMESVAVSESDQRLLRLAPQIMAVKDFASLTQVS